MSVVLRDMRVHVHEIQEEALASIAIKKTSTEYVLVSLFRGEFAGNVNKIEEQGIREYGVNIMSRIKILLRKRIYSYSMHEQPEGVRSTERSVNSRSEARG